jgi:hypothetical protein
MAKARPAARIHLHFPTHFSLVNTRLAGQIMISKEGYTGLNTYRQHLSVPNGV